MYRQELEIGDAPGPAHSMRVDIATSGSSQLYDASKTEHQRSILQQYIAESVNEGLTEGETAPIRQENDTNSTAGLKTDTKRILPEQDARRLDATFARSDSLPSGHSDFRVPTPQLHLSEVWEKGISLPSTSLSSSYKRAHSCHHSETQRQNSKVHPHMYPSFAVSPTPSPMDYTAPPTSDPAFSTSVSTLSLKSVMGQHSAESAVDGYNNMPVAYNAWTPAQPSAPAMKHTALTSSRLMTK